MTAARNDDLQADRDQETAYDCIERQKVGIGFNEVLHTSFC